MTSRERIEAALKHEEPDRTPVFEYVLLSPVAVVFVGFVGATFGGSLFPFVLGIALSIALIAGGLALILNGQKRFRGRRQQ